LHQRGDVRRVGGERGDVELALVAVEGDGAFGATGTSPSPERRGRA
jgi:hypothetical protein